MSEPILTVHCGACGAVWWTDRDDEEEAGRVWRQFRLHDCAPEHETDPSVQLAWNLEEDQ